MASALKLQRARSISTRADADPQIPERRFGAWPLWLVPSAWVRIMLIYRWRHGRWPRLRDPQRFTELVQIRKLYNRDPRLPELSDKVRVKAHVAAAELLGLLAFVVAMILLFVA